MPSDRAHTLRGLFRCMRPRNTHACLAPLHAATVGCCALLCLGLARRVHADDASCTSTPARAPQSTDTATLLDQAKAYATQGDYVRARKLYASILARKPDDRDARLGLARNDAWAQCYTHAMEGYRGLLRKNPEDAEARAGLIDVLLWQDRRADAERELSQGLALSQNSAELWQRRAILSLRNDDRQRALAASERALSIAPNDPELRALRQRMYMSMVRTSLRIDAFPADYPNLYRATLQLWHRIGRVELSADALFQDRAGGALKAPIVDGLYTFGAAYHTGPVATFGVNLGVGAPARSLPRYLARVWLSSNFASRWSAGLSYALWSYGADKTAHIVAPSVAFEPNDDWRFELRGWATWLRVHDDVNGGQVASVFAVGVNVGHLLTRGVRLVTAYTYGPQLDHVVLSPDFVRIVSHVLALSADLALGDGLGLQPIVGIEHRQIRERAQWIWSAELGAYMRW